MNNRIIYEIRLADQRKRLRYSNVSLAKQLHGLVPGRRVDATQSDYEVRRQPSPPQYTLYSKGKTILSLDELCDFVVTLNSFLIRALVDRYAQGLALHSAVLVRNNRSLLLPAGSGAGKTTLTAWLLTRGFDYASDELALAQPDAEVFAFPRPLNLRHQVIPLFERLGVKCDDESMRTKLVYLAQPNSFGACRSERVSRASMIIFPSYRVGADLAFERISPGRAAHLLLGCLTNARNLPKLGLPMASAFSRSIEAWSLTYSSFDQLAPVVNRIAGALE